jgi:hypothetical protein
MKINTIIEINKLPLPYELIKENIIPFFKPKNYLECYICGSIIPFVLKPFVNEFKTKSNAWFVEIKNNKQQIKCKKCYRKKDLKIRFINK